NGPCDSCGISEGGAAMALEATFQDLIRRLRELQEQLETLLVLVKEDAPQGRGNLVSDGIGDSFLAAAGYLDESLAAARAGQQAVISSMDLNGARRAITDCQRCLSRVSHILKFDIYSFESGLNLTRLESE